MSSNCTGVNLDTSETILYNFSSNFDQSIKTIPFPLSGRIIMRSCRFCKLLNAENSSFVKLDGGGRK